MLETKITNNTINYLLVIIRSDTKRNELYENIYYYNESKRWIYNIIVNIRLHLSYLRFIGYALQACSARLVASISFIPEWATAGYTKDRHTASDTRTDSTETITDTVTKTKVYLLTV